MQDTDALHCNLRCTLLKNALYTSVLIYIVLYSSVLRWGQYRTLFYCTVLHCTLVYCNWCRTEEVMPSLSSNGACYLGQHRNSIEKLSIIFPLLVSSGSSLASGGVIFDQQSKVRSPSNHLAGELWIDVFDIFVPNQKAYTQYSYWSA